MMRFEDSADKLRHSRRGGGEVEMTKENMSVEERLIMAEKPGKDAMVLHKYYGGKIEVVPKAAVRNYDDFAIWYSPGVAAPCKAIHEDIDEVYAHTWKWNTVAVVSDGTRVLGLGDIGPEAAMPMMEGKVMLYKYLGGVDAVPICLDTKDPDKIIEAVNLMAPSFGGVNLEDISMPKCFDILDTLRETCKIPVWHDDQQGAATVVYAAAINAMKLVGKDIKKSHICLVGAGAANIAIARLMFAAGINPKNLVMVDSKGILNPEREELKKNFKQKWKMCEQTNGAGKKGGLKEAMEGADIVIAASAPGPGTIPKEYVKRMANDAVVFATANPVPEVWPWEAKEMGAKIVATCRSDFPNQVNNSMGFPAVFRGTLDVRAKTITDEMCIAAAEELAKFAEKKGMYEEYILPLMSDWEVFPLEAVAVAMKAQEQGLARLKLTRQELTDRAEFMIKRSREITEIMMKSGYIADPELAFNK